MDLFILFTLVIFFLGFGSGCLVTLITMKRQSPSDGGDQNEPKPGIAASSVDDEVEYVGRFVQSNDGYEIFRTLTQSARVTQRGKKMVFSDDAYSLNLCRTVRGRCFHKQGCASLGTHETLRISYCTSCCYVPVNGTWSPYPGTFICDDGSVGEPKLHSGLCQSMSICGPFSSLNACSLCFSRISACEIPLEEPSASSHSVAPKSKSKSKRS